MADLTPEQTSLEEQARDAKRALAEIEAAAERNRHETVEIMKRMRDAKMSWAAIGRAFEVTPQAAMYATGAAVRTPKPRRRQPSDD